jgi:polyketide synthase PksM
VGAAVLKILSEAIADGDHIYAVIKNSALNHTGRGLPFFAAPGSIPPGLIDLAFEKTQIPAGPLGYLDVHGPWFNSSGGKPLEIEALKDAFATLTAKIRCGIGSITFELGDLGAAAGIAGLFKILLALRHKKIPTAYYEETSRPPENPEEIRPWECLKDKENHVIPRRAGIIAFGYSGAVSHVMIEEYMDSKDLTAAPRENTPQIIVLSAKNPAHLKAYAGRLRDFLEEANTSALPAAPGTGSLISPLNGRTWRQQIEDDILRISAETLKTDQQGYEIFSIRAFTRRLNETLNLDIAEDLFKAQPSVGAFVKYVRKTYKKELELFYNNPGSPQAVPGSPPSSFLNLQDIAYTLQVGREAMDERMAVAASSIGELKEKLNAYCLGKREIENLFCGNVNDPRGQAALLMEGEEKEEFLKSLIKNRKFAKLGYCWVLGVEVDWKSLYNNRVPKRISLPTYPFEKTKYRITSWQTQQKN